MSQTITFSYDVNTTVWAIVQVPPSNTNVSTAIVYAVREGIVQQVTGTETMSSPPITPILSSFYHILFTGDRNITVVPSANVYGTLDTATTAYETLLNS